MRHTLIQVEDNLGKDRLLGNRDTTTDCFAGSTRPEELARSEGVRGLLCANFKRGQEAARVLEEYSKIVSAGSVPSLAKKARFTLYDLEKKLAIGTADETN
jgi:thiamine-phosphate pyrophosphorylase